MKFSLVSIAPARRSNRQDPASLLADEYTIRSTRMTPCEALTYPTEIALFDALTRHAGRVPAHICLFDPTGNPLSSVEFAHYVGRVRDAGTQRMVLAVGPASGWSAAALERAQNVLSLGRMTLPHELARVVAAEQVYRALTILAGHPYHLGH